MAQSRTGDRRTALRGVDLDLAARSLTGCASAADVSVDAGAARPVDLKVVCGIAPPPADPDSRRSVSAAVGDPDGHDRYGLLDADVDGLLCHECGWRGRHLGLPVYKAYGITALEYKIHHGMRRTKGMVATDIREKLVEHSVAQFPTRTTFVTRRDTALAQRARLSKRLGPSPAGAVASASKNNRGARRVGIVVTCGECRGEFCPPAERVQAEVQQPVLRQPPYTTDGSTTCETDPAAEPGARRPRRSRPAGPMRAAA
jgi:hypothetical protein